MKTGIEIKIIEKETNNPLNGYITRMELSESTVCSDFKNTIKETIKGLDVLTFDSHVLYIGYRKLEDSDNVPLRSGLEYNVFVKK